MAREGRQILEQLLGRMDEVKDAVDGRLEAQDAKLADQCRKWEQSSVSIQSAVTQYIAQSNNDRKDTHEKLQALANDMAVVKPVVEKLDRTMHGNGGVGCVARSMTTAGRVETHEKVGKWAIGILMGSVGVFGALAAAIAWLLHNSPLGG